MSDKELEMVEFDKDYTMEEALLEAKRCLNCPKPLCQTGCPKKSSGKVPIIALTYWLTMAFVRTTSGLANKRKAISVSAWMIHL